MDMRERSPKTKQIILTAARSVFIDRGYTSATISEISERAKFTRRTIYGYFPNKRELFLGVVQEALSVSWNFIADDHDVTSEKDLRDQLYEVAHALNDVFSTSAYVELIRIILSEIHAQPELKVLLSQGITKSSVSAVKTILHNANENDVIARRNPNVAAELFVGGFVFRLYIDGLLDYVPGKVQKYTDDELALYVRDFLVTA